MGGASRRPSLPIYLMLAEKQGCAS